MASVKHLYTGHSDPNDNPELVLSGDAVGNHLYQDLYDNQVWMSCFTGEDGEFYHDGWRRLIMDIDMELISVNNAPVFEGQIGYASSDNSLYIAMRNYEAGDALMWRSMGATLGAWLEP